MLKKKMKKLINKKSFNSVKTEEENWKIEDFKYSS